MATAQKAARSKQMDAIELLKSDHRQVEDWFEKFQKSRNDDRKKKLAVQICDALIVHTKIEEEIFYPAFLEATDEQELNDEAHVEHDSAKKLIEEIEAGEPSVDMWEAKVKVLSEYIKHHVKEEEQRGGMFAKAKQAGVDLEDLGTEMAKKKKELMGQMSRGNGSK